MSLIAKPSALVMLAGALWLTAAERAWAQTSGSNSTRAQFVSLLANRQNTLIAERLQQRLTQLNQESTQLLQHQTIVAIKIANPPPPPVLVRLQQQDQRLQQQSVRIQQRLLKLNNALNNFSGNSSALGQLKNDLTRQEAIIGQRLLTVQRLERAAATPFAPGGF